MISKQLSGARAEFAVAAELSRLGFLVSVVHGGAKAVDLLASREDGSEAFSVQVKSDRSRRSWLMPEHTISAPAHKFVFVYFPERDGSAIEWWAVPSSDVVDAKKRSGKKNWIVDSRDIAQWKGEFGLCFGEAA